jgi:gamma-glutamyltranspeptidase/glutathione hydrolase
MFMARNLVFIVLVLTGLICCTGKAGRNLTIVEGRKIITDSGMVVSAHRESSYIGAEILRKGGNAVDAAVATGFALAVCYPEAGNLGGGGFMIVRSANGSTDMLDFREKAPMASIRDMYLGDDGNVVEGLSTDTQLATGVPGSVDGLINIHSKYGNLPFKDVIQPAIDLARNGFPITGDQAADFNACRDKFISRNKVNVSFVKDSLWKEGDILTQPELASTLERIRNEGRNGFYSGTTARMIIREMERGNGLISQDDLNEYQSVFREPVSGLYRGYRIISASPPSGGGIILLQIMGMIEPWDLKMMGFHSAPGIHLIVEAEKRAFADRSEYLGDPDFTEIKVSALLNREYLKQRMKNFDENESTPSALIFPGEPGGYESPETTHFSVVDAQGNAVAATTTLNGTFGNCIVADSAGFLLNNEMDDFSVKPGVPNMYGLIGGEANSVRPGKRMLSSMTPVIVEKEGRLFMVAGSPGGSTIPTSVLQVILNVIDFGMSLDEAVDAGRFHHQWLPDYIAYERNSLDSLTILKLGEMGHILQARGSIGRVNAILMLPDGRMAGAGDIRGNNVACGY